MVFINTAPDRLFYYGVDGHSDHGWGCVYRAAQNMFYALGMDPVPTLPDMMDDLGVPRTAEGRERWIEPLQAKELMRLYCARGTLFLGRYEPVLVALTPQPARMLRTELGDLDRVHSDWRGFHADVVRHLEAAGVPVVVDDGVVGQCIAGFRGDPGDPAAGDYILIDPHVTRDGAQVRTTSVNRFYATTPMLMALVLE